MGALEGRVAVITGAGRGIGREHALLFAREGASVVVNDLGGANDGTGADAGPAREVVGEIIAAGGRAVANTDDVSEWRGAERLIEQAVSEFGGLDVLVNNAGILRDAFIAGHGEAEWDAVIKVHLKGHFAVLSRAAGYWKAQSKAGRGRRAAVVNTASASGVLVPNAGQASDGSAKAAIAALTLVAAAELDRYGVRVNAIAPIARTRLTLATPGMGAVFAAGAHTDNGHDLFDPSNISPLVAYLAGPECELTGKVFAVQGGSIQELSGWSVARQFETDGPWTIEEIARRLTSGQSATRGAAVGDPA
jgi:NAD(P)-dependent dehydrogenase (short-subunit alcohol dehydrogenase family)